MPGSKNERVGRRLSRSQPSKTLLYLLAGDCQSRPSGQRIRSCRDLGFHLFGFFCLFIAALAIAFRHRTSFDFAAPKVDVVWAVS